MRAAAPNDEGELAFEVNTLGYSREHNLIFRRDDRRRRFREDDWLLGSLGVHLRRVVHVVLGHADDLARPRGRNEPDGGQGPLSPRRLPLAPYLPGNLTDDAALDNSRMGVSVPLSRGLARMLGGELERLDSAEFHRL